LEALVDRYLLFGGDKHYPAGGWYDFKGAFPSVLAALQEALKFDWDWHHVLDAQTRKIIEYRVK
jgi:hypothetical protein